MPRLPQPGGDEGSWGEILNDYLSVAHTADGSLKNESIASRHIATGALDARVLAAGIGSDGQVLTKNSLNPSGISWQNVNAGATSVVMAGDITGPSNNARIAPGAIGTVQMAGSSITTSKLADNSVTPAKLVSGAPSAGEILSYGSGGFEWIAVTSAPVSSVNAKTGAVVISKNDIALSNVDNTSDVDKPVSAAAQLALNEKVTATSLSSVATSGNYSDLVDKPTIPAQFNPIAGTNVSLAGTYPNITVNAATGTTNSSDAALRDRTTHTGTQPISTVVGLQGALDGKLEVLPGGSVVIKADQATAFSTRATGGTTVFNVNTVNNTVSFASAASDPASALNGEMYFNTSSGSLRIYKAGAWTDVSASAPAGSSTVMVYEKYADAPALPVDTIVISRTGL